MPTAGVTSIGPSSRAAASTTVIAARPKSQPSASRASRQETDEQPPDGDDVEVDDDVDRHRAEDERGEDDDVRVAHRLHQAGVDPAPAPGADLGAERPDLGGRGAHGDELVEVEDPVGDRLHEVGVVAREQDAEAVGLLAQQPLGQPLEAGLVEPGLGLVEHQQPARADEGARQREPALLARRQGAGQLGRLRRQPDLLEHVVDQRLGVGHAVGAGEEVEVLDDAEVGEEVHVVEDDREVTPYRDRPLVDRLAVQLDRARTSARRPR